LPVASYRLPGPYFKRPINFWSSRYPESGNRELTVKKLSVRFYEFSVLKNSQHPGRNFIGLCQFVRPVHFDQPRNSALHFSIFPQPAGITEAKFPLQ
jgi:hypothetical protein